MAAVPFKGVPVLARLLRLRALHGRPAGIDFEEVADSVKLGGNELLRKMAEHADRFLPLGWAKGTEGAQTQLRAWMRSKGSAPLLAGTAERHAGLKVEGFAQPRAAAAAAAPALPPGVDARIDGTRLVFDFACAVRCGLPAALGLELRLEATGTVAVAGPVDWRDDWSTETGEVGRTLQLQGFVDAVRIAPDRYELRTPALLRFPGR